MWVSFMHDKVGVLYEGCLFLETEPHSSCAWVWYYADAAGEKRKNQPLSSPHSSSLSSNFLGLSFTDQAQLKSRGHNTPGHHPNSAYPGDTPQCEGSQYLARERSRIIADRRGRMWESKNEMSLDPVGLTDCVQVVTCSDRPLHIPASGGQESTGANICEASTMCQALFFTPEIGGWITSADSSIYLVKQESKDYYYPLKLRKNRNTHNAQRGQITPSGHSTGKRWSWGLAARTDQDSIAHTASAAKRCTRPSAKGTEETRPGQEPETQWSRGCLCKAWRWATWARIY